MADGGDAVAVKGGHGVMQWVMDHWGDVASLLGLIVSLYVLKQARDIRRIVEKRVKHYRSLLVLELLIEARQLTEGLIRSRAKVMGGYDADRLRHVLVTVQSHGLLNDEEVAELRFAVAALQRKPDNNARVKQQLRQLCDRLSGISARLKNSTALTEFE